MANTPVDAPSRFSASKHPDLAAWERDLVERLRKALEPSFILVRRLGAGGMGVVYLARDPALKRLVAVKVLSPDRADSEAQARFQREAEAVAKISHPNVVAVHAVGELSDGTPYLVMQYVEGRSMAERLTEEGPLEVHEAKAVIGQVAAALAAAHAKGIVHRDIKAANILWDDAAGRALVSDFGIAALLERDPDGDAMQLTQTGVVLGTPKYMSPEQLLAERVSEKTDIYSLGLLGYELLAREGPFSVGSSPNQLIVAHLRDAPRPITALRPDVDPAFEALLSGCLEKDPHARPDAEDVARRLRHSTSVVLEWPPPGLEDLQGAAVPPVQRFFFGAAAVALPMTLLLSTQPGELLYVEWPAAVALPALMFVGALACALAVGKLLHLLPTSIRAIRAGYTWEVLATVLVDDGKDMGTLIAGEREFAALDAEKRESIRSWRILRRGALLGGGAWGLAGVLLALPLGARAAGSPFAFSSILLGVPLGAQLLSLWLAERERKLVAPIRARLRRHLAPLDRLTALAATWRAAFDRVATERFARAAGRVTRRLVLAGIVGGMAIIGVGLMTGMVVVATIGKTAVSIGFPSWNTSDARYARAARLEFLRPVIDPSITPLAAGEALHSLQAAGHPNAHPRFGRVPREVLPAIVLPQRGPSVFGRDWRAGVGMRAAARGLSAPQRSFLEAMASQPGQRQLETIGRAAQVDWFKAAVVQPVPAEMSIIDVPVPSLTRIRNAVTAQTARAVLARADGRNADAERLLRDVVGVGLNLMQGQTIIENLVGANIVVGARDELVALYETTGRGPEAQAISVALDPPQPSAGSDDGERTLSAEEQDVRIDRVIQDSSLMPGRRWEFAANYRGFKPCTELRQIVFGPGPDHQERMAEARRLLVRTASDDAVMTLAERLLETPLPASRSGSSWAQQSMRGFARVVDAMTGSKRMSSCVAFMNGRIGPR